jgi:hypothetical protein
MVMQGKAEVYIKTACAQQPVDCDKLRPKINTVHLDEDTKRTPPRMGVLEPSSTKVKLTGSTASMTCFDTLGDSCLPPHP